MTLIFVCLLDDLILYFLVQKFDTGNRWTQIRINYHSCIASELTNQVCYSPQIHLLVIAYYFENIDHDTCQNFVFKHLPKLFPHVIVSICDAFHYALFYVPQAYGTRNKPGKTFSLS